MREISIPGINERTFTADEPEEITRLSRILENDGRRFDRLLDIEEETHEM